jgi:hypothetical protein
MAYGTQAGVIGIVPKYAQNGAFNSTTRPNATQVARWISQISNILDTALEEFGFSTPVTAAEVVEMCDFFVEAEVASMVEGHNGSGRFGPTDKKSGGRWPLAILKDAREWIEANAAGIEAKGATRARSSLSGLGFRDVDVRGNSTFPLVQRDGFSAGWIDWDSA